MVSTRKIHLEDLGRVRKVSAPRISGDGERLVFSVTESEGDANRYVTQIYLMDIDGEPRQITNEGSNNRNPLWAPSGSEISYISNASGKPALRRLRIKEGLSDEVCSMEGSISLPEWSPDSKRILFLARTSQGELKNNDVLVIRRLPYKFNGLGWLRDTWNHLFVVDTNGGEPVQVTEGEYDVSSATWAPDARRIAYIANKSENADITAKNDVWIYDFEKKSHSKITDGKRALKSLAFSPDDGSWLAMIGNTRRYGLATKNDIYAINLLSGEERNLTSDFVSKVGDSVSGGTGASRGSGLVWSKDSREIYFLNAMDGNMNLYKANLDSAEVELVSDTSRSMQSFSFSKDKTVMAFLSTDIMSPSEVWVRDSKGIRKQSSFNDDLFDELSLSRGEKFTLKASDGVPVDCWYYSPVESTEDECPMVLLVKGGPHMSGWGNALSVQVQLLAANGYAVLLTNERGTGGYGEEFARTARAVFYGQREYQDIMEAVDHVEEKYPVDTERLNVMGYSRGGFLTNWIITHTDRFNSAITAGGFSDVYSFFSTGDYMHVWCEKNYEGTPWDDEELYMSKSPLRYVKNVTTPTLIMHAMEDYRASVTQAEQLYVSLKRLRKETEMILFPGENHSLPRASSPQHLKEYHSHMLRWFDRFNNNPAHVQSHTWGAR